jgi:transcriptional regulator with XRE-family HTH domain
MDTIAKRLKWAREQKLGKDSVPSEVARDHRWTVSTYLGHENGDRNPSRASAKKYARTYGVRWEWLLEGEGQPSTKGIRRPTIAGRVGAGAEIIPVDDEHGHDPVDLPPPDVIPVVVQGDSMYPRYFNGETLFYLPEQRAPDELIGRECVVKLEDGRMLVKIVRKGARRNRFNLESWNAPTLEDQAIEWASPVRWRA